MPSPFPISTSKPGHGTVHLTLVGSTPTFSTLSYSYPLKLLPSVPHKLNFKPGVALAQDNDQQNNAIPIPVPTASTSPLLFLLNYGGGLLAGDSIAVTLTLDPGTRLCCTTQGMTRVYAPASPSATSSPKPPILLKPSSQTLTARISTHAALWLVPDPVQPFAGSHYTQHQSFEVEQGGSVGFVDWVTEGRTARGENWDLGSWRGRNDVYALTKGGDGKKRLLVRDAMVFEQPGLRGRMDSMGVVGTVVLRGPLFEVLGRWFVEEFAALPRIGGRDWGGSEDGVGEEVGRRQEWRKKRQEKEKREQVLWSACQVRGCTVVKFVAPSLQPAKEWLVAMLREEGTVVREFGPCGGWLER